MGECIIARSSCGTSGGGSGTIIASAPPVLNSSNPIDTELFIKNNQSIILTVFIEENNINCTYQWFINNYAVPGATEAIFEYIPEDTYAVNKIKCAVTNSAGTIYSREASITIWPTRLYIIKDSKIVDPTAVITPKASSGVTVSEMALSVTTTGNGKYAILSSDLLKNYNSAVCATYTTNANYNSDYSFEIVTLNEDFVIINTSGKKYTITNPLDSIAIIVSTKTANYIGKITVNEFYVE